MDEALTETLTEGITEADALVEASPPEELPLHGYVDFYGYHTVSGSWIFCGWVDNHLWALETYSGIQAVGNFEGGNISGGASYTLYYRADLGSKGIGFVVILPSSGRFLGSLNSLHLTVGPSKIYLKGSTVVQQFRAQDLDNQLRPVLEGVIASPEPLRVLLGRRAYTGQDTLEGMSERVFFEVDEMILCPPDSLFVLGWHLAPPGIVKSVRLRSGQANVEFPLNDVIWLERGDVVDSVGRPNGLTELRCGFAAFLPNAFMKGERTYFEIENIHGEVAYRNVPAPKLRGMDAIKRLLDVINLRYAEVAPAFDKVIGPGLGLLNQQRLSVTPKIDMLTFGDVNDHPEYSIIIPMYGRMDFLEYQMAFFSQHKNWQDFEYIYVLDDPAKRRFFEALAESVHARFRVPFRTILLDRNVGFAPANNIGLRHARGRYICYLNSDVFPQDLDWMERLTDRLRADPDLGVVGPLLLFEDGSVQHEGIEFKPLLEFGGWMFSMHSRKGYRPSGQTGLKECVAITGACMVLERELAVAMNGFDPSFIIGDFEDTDLCLKIARLGKKAAVDLDVKLYHLERKSQADPGNLWRMNLTLYNAWLHQHRWFDTKDAQSHQPIVPH